MKRHPIATHRFIRFLLVGLLNTVFGYSIFAVLILVGLHYKYAALIGTICGVLFNFKTIGTFVFANKNNMLIFRFVCVYIVTYFLSVGALKESDRVMNQTFWIGVYPGLSKEMLDYVIGSIQKTFL